MSLRVEAYGTLKDGRAVQRFTLECGELCCRILDYGGIVTELWVPDAQGERADVVLGLPSLEAYEKGHPYFGAITGRVAGRISGGRFELMGEELQLLCNQEPNHLHGGEVGLDKRIWDAQYGETSQGEPWLELCYLSPHGEEGYPGTVNLMVRYTLTRDAALRIDYDAETDRPSILSLTNHSYFHLAGEGSGDLAGHSLQISAEQMVQAAEDGTLSDEAVSVAGTAHDFREARLIDSFIAAPHNLHGEHYLLRKENAALPEKVAELSHAASGRRMEVLTTTTGLQLYTGKFLDDEPLTGKAGAIYPAHGGLCLECQGYPNAMNAPHIDDIGLCPGQRYQQTTLYRFI